jgi:chemotaxis protein MotB
MAKEDVRPIVIKRIKKAAHAHHGGVWKIAYADFVTAMMAFFLLMWLLGSTTKGDLNGIADYFQTPLKVALSGGSGSGDSSSVIKGGGQDLTRQNGQVKRGDTETARRNINLQAAKAELERQDRVRLEELKLKVEAALAGNPRIAAFTSQIRLDITQEGLRIQIVDEQNRPMFDTGRAKLKDYTIEILREIGKVLESVDHKVTLSGHTDAAPYAGGEKGYSNWELSADRANAARRELLASGLDETKVMRVLGLASSLPFDAGHPFDPTNRRISIVVLNRATEEALRTGGPVVNAASAADLAPEAPAAPAQAAPSPAAAPNRN